MEDGEWLSTDELLRRVPLSGDRPDAVLKRLRRAGILGRPMAMGRGRGRGVGQLHPPGTEARLRRVVALRRDGVRSHREMRWRLWFEGADDLWPRVQEDLVAAYPLAEQAATDALIRADPEEGLLDEVDRATRDATESWDRSRYPPFDRRKVRTLADRRDVVGTGIEAAIPEVHPDLSETLEDETVETKAGLLDRAYGTGAADALQRGMELGVTDWAGWYDALRDADAPRARFVADLWRTAFGSRIDRELRFSVSDWADRALTTAALLYAVGHGMASAEG